MLIYPPFKQGFSQILILQSNPTNLGLHLHAKLLQIPLPLQSLGQIVFSHATP